MPVAPLSRGTWKKFYAYAVDRVNPGAGQDTTLVVGGYKSEEDGAIAAGQYPDNQITSYSTCLTKCAAFVNRFQQSGIDARGRCYVRLFGQNATDPVTAMPANIAAEREFAHIDVPEKDLDLAISLANTPKPTETNGGQLPQDIDNPVAG